MAEIKKRFSKKKNKYTFTASIRLVGNPSLSKTFDRLTDAKEWASQTESDIRRGISLSRIFAQSLLIIKVSLSNLFIFQPFSSNFEDFSTIVIRSCAHFF